MKKDDIRSLGESLRPIRQDLLKNAAQNGQMQGGTSLWYQGGEKYFDLFLDFVGDELVHFQFSLRGQYIEWQRDRKLVTGTTNEFKNDPAGNPRSKILSADRTVNQDFIGFARAILMIQPNDANLTVVANTLAD